MKTNVFHLHLLFGWTLWILLTSAFTAQQQAPGFIRGVVTDVSTGMPMSKVTVEIRTPAGVSAVDSTVTDSDGRFFLSNVKPGKYKVVAMRAGYANSEFGQRRPGGPSQNVTVAPGQRIADMPIAMTRAGIISGRVLDNGMPVGIADVVAVRITYIEAQPSFSLVLMSKTNDLGEYHIFWLPPGKYVVMAVVWDTASSVATYMTPDGSNDNTFITTRRSLRAVFNRAIGSGAAENEAHVPFYYPNTPDPQSATVLEIRPGSELRNIDIQASAIPTRHVKGTISGAIPPPNPNLIRAGLPAGPSIRLIPLQSTFGTSDAQTPFANAEANGSFEFKNVIAGRYLLVTTVGAMAGSTLVEMRDRDIDGVGVTLTQGLSVSGKAVLDGPTSSTSIPPPGLRITLRGDPLIPGVPTYSGVVGADGSFAIPSLSPNPNVVTGIGPPPGTYRVFISPILVPPLSPETTVPILPPAFQNAYVKSIRFGEIDVLKDGLHLDHAIDDLKIVIGTSPGTLDGHVLNNQRQPLSSAVVALVPDSGLRYRINHKWVSSDASGAFQFKSVPPGDYLLYAWESIETGAWQDAGVMRDYESQGRAIHVDEGGNVTTDIVVIPSRN